MTATVPFSFDTPGDAARAAELRRVKTEATLVLASMIQAFRIERGDNDPVEPIAIVTTQPDHPPPFRLQRRVRA